MSSMGDMFVNLGSTFGTIMLFYTLYEKFFPENLRHQIKQYTQKYTQKLTKYFNPYIQISFNEYEQDSWYQRSKAFAAIERYLGSYSSDQAKRLKAKVAGESEAVILSMADHEEVTDEYKGIKVWWASEQYVSNEHKQEHKRIFKLTFHRQHRDFVTNSYIKRVLGEGKAISVSERQRKLYTNKNSDGVGYFGVWSHVKFEHPSTFDTLALDPKLKQEIIDDLVTFSKSKEYYSKIGKAWKRGYLLYGPPGTGKSSMIAAMANFMKYDVYDIELTAVKDNTSLRRLLIDTSSKSIVVIEDIDCSVDFTKKRKVKVKVNKEEKEGNESSAVKEKKKEGEDEKKESKVTLSGLLNCIDGLWSTCSEERIFVFTTNFVDKLDPALVRRGRMDKHIEMSYCRYEVFKVLARNYLNQHSDHELFPTIGRLLDEVDISPADVAENLMPKSADDNATACFTKLIKALEEAKEKARLKAEAKEEGAEPKEEGAEAKEEGAVAKLKGRRREKKNNKRKKYIFF